MCFQLVSITGKCHVKEVPLVPKLLKRCAHILLKIVPFQAKFVIPRYPSHVPLTSVGLKRQILIEMNWSSEKSEPASGGLVWWGPPVMRKLTEGRFEVAGKPQKNRKLRLDPAIQGTLENTTCINARDEYIYLRMGDLIPARLNEPAILIDHICHNRHNQRWCTFLS